MIGLAASRISERLHRPSIVLSIENGIAHGSARSVGDFHLLNALETCSDLFEQFGGHAAAAGMKIRSENIEQLKARLHEYAESEIAVEDTTPEIVIDALVTPKTLNLDLHNTLKKLEPFGAGNVKPIFSTRGLRLRFEPRVMKDKHLKLHLNDGDGRRFEAVWWDGVARSQGRTLNTDSSIEVAYTLDRNEWQGNVTLQLVVQDIRTDN